jgi:probable rRNA maturation factor
MVSNFYVQIKGKAAINKKNIPLMIAAAAKILKLKTDFEITVLLVGSKKIRELNREFRHKDKVTDVLSFSQKEGEKIVLPVKEAGYLGDIVICYPVLKKQARLMRHSPEKEFNFLLIHGFLHLLGYNDQTQKEYRQMEKIQNKILNSI